MEHVKIYAKTIEESARLQIDELANSEAYGKCRIRIMPDVHAGAGCTIGTVIDIDDRIVPNTVGVDIGCGMLVVELGKVDIDMPTLDTIINNVIPSGFNIRCDFIDVFPDYHKLRCKEILDEDNVLRSIGTLGGGNHFIEIDEDVDGNKYLVIHTGSRNLGKRVCDHYQRIAMKCCDGKDAKRKLVEDLKSQGREKDIQSEVAKLPKAITNKDLAYLDVHRDGNLFFDYLNDMTTCQRYADLNRHVIARLICINMGWKPIGEFTTIHNYIDMNGTVLRKGAVSARKGECLIIPMNMRDGSLICRGKGNLEWLFSAPHGAGRIMSRGEARKTLQMEDFTATMSGIYSTSVCEETIDESPMAYKPISEIMECIKDTVEIVNIIKPIYNFKAKEQINRKEKNL